VNPRNAPTLCAAAFRRKSINIAALIARRWAGKPKLSACAAIPIAVEQPDGQASIENLSWIEPARREAQEPSAALLLLEGAGLGVVWEHGVDSGGSSWSRGRIRVECGMQGISLWFLQTCGFDSGGVPR